MSDMSTCPRTDRLLRLLGDDLPEIEQTELIAHLDSCPDCRGALDRLAARSGIWNDLALLRDNPLGPPTGDLSKGPEAGPPDEEEIPVGLLEPSDDPGHLGKLGPYDILRLIGRGGMGIVFLARDRALDRLVAIKLLTPGMAATGATRRRFAREAKAAAAVVHEHVVTIHAVDTLPQGVPYLVMQYIAGKSVQELIDRGKAPELAEILRIGSQAAGALAAAHAQGLIHRDIKPANILLENGVERVKITDFGLARAVDDATMTQSGVVAGTPQYMSPEQAGGEPIDHRTDLFSLGSVLYALCTGQAPFRGGSSMATLKRVCEQTPRPIQAFNPEIPSWLVKIIDRLHAKDPADRYGSAAEVADLLGRCLAHVQQPASVPLPAELLPARNRRALALWGALPACLLLAAILGSPAAREAAAQAASYVATVLRLKTPEGTLVVETDDPNIGIKLDGSELVVTGAGVKELRLSVGEHKLQTIKDGKILRDELVTISRGGRTVLTVRREMENPQPPPTALGLTDAPWPVRREEWQRAQAGRPSQQGPVVPKEKLVLESLGSEVRSVCFSPDGRDFAFGTKEGLIGITAWRFKPGGGPSATFKAHPGGVESVAFSPDGKTLVSGGWDHHVKLWDIAADPSSPRLLWDFAGFSDGVRSVAFSPGGDQILAGGFDKAAIVLNAKDGLRIWTSPALEQPINGVQFSPDGRFLAMALGDYSKGTPGNPVGQPGEVQVWSWPGRRRIATLRGWTRECKSVAFSPDSRLVAATSGDGTVRLYEKNRNTFDEKAVLQGGPWTAGVAFRPDSMQFANSNWSGQVLIWSLNGPKVLTSFQAHDENIPCIAFSPDGRSLATACADGSVKIWDVAGRTDEARHELLKIDAAEEVNRLANALKRNPPHLTPDKGMKLFMRDLAEGRTTLIADAAATGLTFASDPDWSHDGTRIVFHAAPRYAWEGSRIIVLESRDGRPSFRVLGAGCRPKFSPDDQTIAFLLPPSVVPGAEEGVWLMNADGTNRRRVAPFGAPFWSLDGTRLLINAEFEPITSDVLDLATNRTTRINVPGQKIFSWPRWADTGRLVACVGQEKEPDSIVLLDVKRPEDARVVRKLWTRSTGPNVFVRWPLVSPSSGDCFFIGDEGNTRTLYALSPDGGRGGRLSALEVGGPKLGGLSVSPDGRYLLFDADWIGSETSSRLPESTRNDPTPEVDRLADLLKRNPPRHSAKTGVRMQLYMRDLVGGMTRLIADEPVRGLSWTGAPDWSHDGKRIAFDTSPGKDWQQSRLMILEGRDGRPSFRELGAGNCPRFSPDDQRIAFLLNPDAVPGEQDGVWLMNADGTNRRRLCGFGAPFWSPDGTQILVNSFSDPTVSELCSVATGETTRINVPGQQIFSWPRWAGPGRLVACIGSGAEPDSIVLLDVSRPDRARVLETLWQRSRGPDVYPRWPLFVAGTGDCYFVGVKGDLRTLYMISQKSGDTGHVYEVEGAGHADELGGLSLSPDGRYLLFGANRPDREQPPPRVPGAVRNHPARAADQLAEVLKGNPPRPSTPDGTRMQLYLRDLQDGGTTVIADEPVAGLTRTSSPCWSNDGRRIAFHATPRNDWGLSRLLVMRALEGKPVIDDLGHGSSPAFGPGDESIAFLVWPGARTVEQPGVWIMRSDGTERRRLTDLGAPFWSPDGEWIMINHFGDPTECRLRHLATGKEETVRVAGHHLWSWPRWVGPDRIVAVIRKGDHDAAIALLDVTKPAAAEVVKILWTRGPALDVLPRWPLYRATTGETLFVGVTSPNFRNLYRLSPNSGGRAEPLQDRPLQDQLEGLFLSPGERYLLFNANRPDRELPPKRTPVSTRNDPAGEALRLAEAINEHPPKPSSGPGTHMQVYLRDLVAGRTSLIVDEPARDLAWSGTPDWSHDGTRIIFDTSSRMWTRSRLMILESRDGRPGLRDLGPGICGKFSPDDRRIAFSLNPGDMPDDAGIWIMNADGSDRRRLITGGYGAPFWSDDRRQLLINTFEDPANSRIYDFSTQETTRVTVPGSTIFSWPRWAGPRTLVASIGVGAEPDSIVLPNVGRPDQARITRTLWKRSDGPDVYARWPLYSLSTGACYFIGVDGANRSILKVVDGTGAPAGAVHVEGAGRVDRMGGLNQSPDGRFLIFNADRPDRATEATGFRLQR